MGARELSQGLVRPPIERFREPPQRLSSQKFRLAAPDIYNYTLLGANIYGGNTGLLYRAQICERLLSWTNGISFNIQNLIWKVP